LRWRMGERRHRRSHWPPVGMRGLPQVDGEAIPLSELDQLALGDGHFDGLRFC
jgi:hypothetical protein